MDSGLFQHVPRGDGKVNHRLFLLQCLPDLILFLRHLRHAKVARCVNVYCAELPSSLTLFHACLSDFYLDKLVGLVYG